MKLYYRTDNGEIIYAVRDADTATFVDSCNLPHATMTIDEVAANAVLVADLALVHGRQNAAGLGKYYIANDVLMQRAAWQIQQSR